MPSTPAARPADPTRPDPDQVRRYTEGQCHALALAVAETLEAAGVPHRIVAIYADPALTPDPFGRITWSETGTAGTAENTRHIVVVRDDTGEAVDIHGRLPEAQLLDYAYAGVYGDWLSSDDAPLVLMTVNAAWVHALEHTGSWQPPDVPAARALVDHALHATNPWPRPPGRR